VTPFPGVARDAIAEVGQHQGGQSMHRSGQAKVGLVFGVLARADGLLEGVGYPTADSELIIFDPFQPFGKGIWNGSNGCISSRCNAKLSGATSGASA